MILHASSAADELIHRYHPEIKATSLELMPHPGWGGDSDAWLVVDRLRQVESTVIPVLTGDERDWVECQFRDFLAKSARFAYAPVLCHGDLCSDHILFDHAGTGLAGIIDFGDVTIGDPAGEFTWRADYGESFFEQVLQAYGVTDRPFAERVAFQIDCLPLIQIAYGVERGRPDDIAEGRRLLRWKMSVAREAGGKTTG